jgi:hypothetical protein
VTPLDCLFAHHLSMNPSVAGPSRIVALHARRPKHRMGRRLFTKKDGSNVQSRSRLSKRAKKMHCPAGPSAVRLAPPLSRGDYLASADNLTIAVSCRVLAMRKSSSRYRRMAETLLVNT